MRDEAGFTLIETLITTLILVTGLAAVAGVFVYGVHTSERIQQQTKAFEVLTQKMEELKTAETRIAGRFSEYVGDQQTFLRTWEISTDLPQRITVIVSGRQPGHANRYRELARASTVVGPGF